MRSVAIGRLRDCDAVDRCSALQTRGGVDDVPGDDSFALLRAGAERDDRLSRVDPDADLERERCIVRVQLLDRLEHPQSRTHGALGIVLMRNGRAEHGHHGVADELLHRSSVQLDLVP